MADLIEKESRQAIEEFEKTEQLQDLIETYEEFEPEDEYDETFREAMGWAIAVIRRQAIQNIVTLAVASKCDPKKATEIANAAKKIYEKIIKEKEDEQRKVAEKPKKPNLRVIK